jgi:membrane-bound lytic murein transglycosylase B
VETLGDRVDALTIKQLAMAKETFELAQQEGRTRGWNEQQQRAVLQELLVSPDYLALEEKKAPFEQQMTAYKQAARSASTFTEAQSICRKSVALLRAIESSFAINTLEYSLAQRLIRSHP